ncbi:toxoplasma gondii family a protein [Cystoisospora suis]|uniref:Toxoplasma gondii family a protein n=1 Tax=Cystoisospora suis TaxID=483139 RepID=A0A2C6KGA7_9APIC|nr:toxoplasma gondii family a protein [Cystoisospora suis]
MARQLGPRGVAFVALSLAVFCRLFVQLSVLAAPQGQPDYSIVIPIDGIPRDDRYDFWLEGDDTFQIVDKSPGFSAIIEPPTFSQEAYAYSSPDCDLTKKIEYKQEFSHAKEGHTFWKRDLERDALDGRKYTFTMPPPEDLLDMVEFCLVITAPSKARDPDDPNVVFRRRLQDIESFDATEHSLTVVIHAGSQTLSTPELWLCSPPRSLPDPPPGKEREVEDPLKRGPGSHGVLEWLIDAKNNLRHRPDPQLGRTIGGRVLSANDARLASSEAHKKASSSDTDEEERKRRKEWMALRRAHQLELRQQIRRRYEQIETEKSPPSQDGCRSDDSFSSQRGGRRGDLHQSSHRSRAIGGGQPPRTHHKGCGTSDGLGGGRGGHKEEDDGDGGAIPQDPTAMSLAHFLKKNAQQLRDIHLRRHRRCRRRYSHESSSRQEDSDDMAVTRRSHQDRRGGKKESNLNAVELSTDLERRRRHHLSLRGNSQKEHEVHKDSSPTYRGKLFVDKGVGERQQEDSWFSDSHFDDSSGDEAFVCRLSAPSLDSNDLKEEDQDERKKKKTSGEESFEGPHGCYDEDDHYHHNSHGNSPSCTYNKKKCQEDFHSISPPLSPSKHTSHGVSSLDSYIRKGDGLDKGSEGEGGAIRAPRRQASMEDHHRGSRLRPPLRENGGRGRGEGEAHQAPDETSHGQSEDSTSSKDERSISRWSEESEGDKNFGRIPVSPLNPSYVSDGGSQTEIHRNSIDLHRQKCSPRPPPSNGGVARRVSNSPTSSHSSCISSSSSPPLVPIDGRSGGESEKEESPWYRDGASHTSCPSSSFSSSSYDKRPSDAKKQIRHPFRHLCPNESIPGSTSTSQRVDKSMKPFVSSQAKRGSFGSGGIAGCLVDDLAPQSPLPRGSNRKKREKKSLTGLFALDPRHLNLTSSSPTTSSGVYAPLSSPSHDGHAGGDGRISSSNSYHPIPSSSSSLSPSRRAHAPLFPRISTTTSSSTSQHFSRSTPPCVSFPHPSNQRTSTTSSSSSSSSSFFSPPSMSPPSPAHPSSLFYPCSSPSPSSSSPPPSSTLTRHPSLIPTRTSDFTDPLGGAGNAGIGMGGEVFGEDLSSSPGFSHLGFASSSFPVSFPHNDQHLGNYFNHSFPLSPHTRRVSLPEFSRLKDQGGTSHLHAACSSSNSPTNKKNPPYSLKDLPDSPGPQKLPYRPASSKIRRDTQSPDRRRGGNFHHRSHRERKKGREHSQKRSSSKGARKDREERRDLTPQEISERDSHRQEYHQHEYKNPYLSLHRGRDSYPSSSFYSPSPSPLVEISKNRRTASPDEDDRLNVTSSLSAPSRDFEKKTFIKGEEEEKEKEKESLSHEDEERERISRRRNAQSSRRQLLKSILEETEREEEEENYGRRCSTKGEDQGGREKKREKEKEKDGPLSSRLPGSSREKGLPPLFLSHRGIPGRGEEEEREREEDEDREEEEEGEIKIRIRNYNSDDPDDCFSLEEEKEREEEKEEDEEKDQEREIRATPHHFSQQRGWLGGSEGRFLDKKKCHEDKPLLFLSPHITRVDEEPGRRRGRRHLSSFLSSDEGDSQERERTPASYRFIQPRDSDEEEEEEEEEDVHNHESSSSSSSPPPFPSSLPPQCVVPREEKGEREEEGEERTSVRLESKHPSCSIYDREHATDRMIRPLLKDSHGIPHGYNYPVLKSDVSSPSSSSSPSAIATRQRRLLYLLKGRRGDGGDTFRSSSSASSPSMSTGHHRPSPLGRREGWKKQEEDEDEEGRIHSLREEDRSSSNDSAFCGWLMSPCSSIEGTGQVPPHPLFSSTASFSSFPHSSSSSSSLPSFLRNTIHPLQVETTSTTPSSSLTTASSLPSISSSSSSAVATNNDRKRRDKGREGSGGMILAWSSPYEKNG